ncbi:MAG: ParB/RepB/Spo0J family partition protein [Chloroflexota bacterium]|nr:ParB/RepB/Spo0J family partition protein [Chloroflexota bacterium]
MTSRKPRGWTKRQDSADDAALDYSSVVRRQEGQTVPVPVALDSDGDRVNRDALLVDHGRIRPDPEQPRKTMDRAALLELAGSILEHGLLQPLVVREDAPDQHGDNRYTIVAGGRRWAAIEFALRGELGALDEVTQRRLRRVPVLLDRSDGAVRRIRQLIENIQRQALPPLEEARAVRELMQLERLSAREIARRLHKSHPYVNDRLAVLDEEAIGHAVERNLLSFTAATELRKLTDTELRHQLLAEVQQGRHLRVADIRALRGRPTTVRITAVKPPGNGSQEMEGVQHPSDEPGEWKITFQSDTSPVPAVADGPTADGERPVPGEPAQTLAGGASLAASDRPPASSGRKPPDELHPAATDAWVRHVAGSWLRWLAVQEPNAAEELRAAILAEQGAASDTPEWWDRFFLFVRKVIAEGVTNP